jgi:hypothetical protein
MITVEQRQLIEALTGRVTAKNGRFRKHPRTVIESWEQGFPVPTRHIMYYLIERRPDQARDFMRDYLGLVINTVSKIKIEIALKRHVKWGGHFPTQVSLHVAHAGTLQVADVL